MTRHSIILGYVSCALISLTFLRCGPIAPSLSKTTTVPDGVSQSAPPVREAHFKVLVTVPVQVSRGETALDASSDSHTLVLDDTQLLEFKKSHAVKLTIPLGSIPNTEHAVIQIGSGGNEISGEDLALLAISLIQNSGDTWTLKMTDDSRGETAAQTFFKKVLDVTVIFTFDASRSQDSCLGRKSLCE